MDLLDKLPWRVRKRNAAYRSLFTGPVAEDVLKDLYRFCLVGAECFVPGDPLATAHNLGKRRVGLRIASILNMTDEQILQLATQPQEISDDER